MNVSKKSFIAFAVLACCFGASTLGTHVDASYGYKYTDSVRPPVETPTNDAFRANMVTEQKNTDFLSVGHLRAIFRHGAF